MQKKPFLNSLCWLWISFFVIALDQWSKFFITQHLSFQEPVEVNRFFNLYLDYNVGAAFSFLKNAGGWQVWIFVGIAVIVSLFILIHFIKTPQLNFLNGVGLALILGGAIGNLIDRCLHRYVIDFISWHIGPHYFPTFNVADSAVSVGVALLFLGLFDKRQKDLS